MTRTTTVSIVGGGVAGLAAGTLLARRGVRVQVFEARDEAGGCSGSTRVGGYTFHDGAQYVALPGLLDAAYARIGLDRQRLFGLRRADTGYTATLEDRSVVSMSPRRLRVRRPGGAGELVLDADVERFVSRWTPFVRLLADDLLLRPFSPWRLVVRGLRELPKLRGTLADELHRAFSDERARSALAGLMLYTGTTADRLPVAAVFGLAALLDEGFFLPEGGMGRIPDSLADALRAAGGELHTGARVEHIRRRIRAPA